MKPLITLKPFLHRGGEHIGIYFQNNLSLNILIKDKAGGKWSQTGKCWYVPISREAYEKIKTALPVSVTLDSEELKKYLEKKNQLLKKSIALTRTDQGLHHPVRILNTQQLKLRSTISPVNKHVLPAMQQMLKLKAF